MDEVFKLPDGLYTVSDIQDYCEYIIKNHKTFTDNPPVRIYVYKIENRISFKIKTGYYLEPLTPERMRLLGSIKRKITKDKKGEFISNESLGQLLDISPKNVIFLKTFDSEFSYILKYGLFIKILTR